MLKESRNKVKKYKSNLLFYLVGWMIAIFLDCIVIYNYAEIAVLYPGMGNMLKFIRLSKVISSWQVFSIQLTPEAIEMFFKIQYSLILVYAIIVLSFISYLLKPKSDFRSIEHGSAEWASKSDMKRFRNGKNTIVLADGLYLDPLDKEADNLNECLIGGSGAGKSFRKIKPDILQMTGSYVVTDPKGELYRDTAYILKKKGYKVKVLNLLQPKYTDGYNPFHYINKNSIESDVLVLVNVFMKNTSDQKKQGGDQFWDDATKALLTAIIFYLVMEKDEQKTFERVFQLVRNISVDEETGEIDADSELEKIFSGIKESDLFHPGLQAYEEFKLAAGKTAKSILISLAVRLNIWINPDICNMTYKDEMEMDCIGTEKTALFMIVPDTDETFNVIASMFYTQLFKVLFYEADYNNNGRLPLLVNCELDEFANIGEIPGFDKYIATMRSRNVRVTLVLQALAQLEKLYKESWEVILGCCYIFNYLGTTDQKTQEFVSKRLGKATVFLKTQSNSKSSKSSSLNENGSYVARELMTPAEINQMSNKNSIVIMKGLRPLFCEKFKTQYHPLINYTGSSFADGIKNNTNIEKAYSKKAEDRQEEALKRRIEKLKSMKFNKEKMEEEALQMEEQRIREFEEGLKNFQGKGRNKREQEVTA